MSDNKSIMDKNSTDTRVSVKIDNNIDDISKKIDMHLAPGFMWVVVISFRPPYPTHLAFSE
jgi:hypothetical protein